MRAAGMEKQVVFSDIDGTLLNRQGKITPKTQEAIRILQSKGIPFVLVSARSPSGIYPILHEYGFSCPIISYSGGLILDESRQVLFHKGLPKPFARKIISVIESSGLDLAWCVYSLDQWLVKDRRDPRIAQEEAIVRATAQEGSVDSAQHDQISKILCIGSPKSILAAEAQLKRAFPRCSIVRSADFLLEIMEQGVTKAAAAKTLCSLWNIPVAQTLAFGDHYNDEDLLQAVGAGFLMGNAPAELKKRLPRHTKDNDHDGIYWGLFTQGLI